MQFTVYQHIKITLMKDQERLNSLVEFSGLKINLLAKRLGFTNGSILYNIKAGRNGISANLAKRIAEAYPDINQNWLLTGKGEMTIKKEVPTKDQDFLEELIKGEVLKNKKQNERI